MSAPKKPRAKKSKQPATMKEAAAMANAPKGQQGQQRIAVDSRDVQRIHASHEVPRPMSDADYMLTAAQAATEQGKAERLEQEIHDFVNGKRCTPQGEPLPSRKEEAKACRETAAKLLREVFAKAHLVVTPVIEFHDPNTGTITIYIDHNGEPGEKVTARRMTDQERKNAQEGAPFAPPAGEPVELDEDAPAEPRTSVLEDRETDEERRGGLFRGDEGVGMDLPVDDGEEGSHDPND